MSKVGDRRFYWEWCKFTIDFREYQDFKSEYNNWDWPEETSYKDKYNGNGYKLQYGIRYLGLPKINDGINEWYNGGWSSEYNQALWYLIELGFIRKVEE
jgi:hypothetical protein